MSVRGEIAAWSRYLAAVPTRLSRATRATARNLRRSSARLSSSVRELLASRIAEGLPGVVARIVKPHQVGRPVVSQGNRNAVATAYTQSSLINACINEKATSAAEPWLVALRDGEPAPATDPLQMVAKRPNPEDTPYTFTERVVTDLETFGEAIIHKLRSGAGLPRELWPLEVAHISPIPAEDGSIDFYEQSDGNKIDPRDIIHIKYPNPTNPYRGLSKIYVLNVEGTLDKDAILYLGEFFRNAGMPSMVITSPQQVSDIDKKALQRHIKDTYGPRGGYAGGTGYHDPMILSNGATAQPFGVQPGQLDLGSIFDVSESRVCAVFGVPAVLVQARIGLLQSTAYGTAREARRSFWGETLAPLYERLSQCMTHGMAFEFGPRYQLRYDLTGVQALQEAKSQLIKDAGFAFNSGMWTRDEARLHSGQRPIDNGVNVWAPEFKAKALSDSKAVASLPLPEPGPRALPELVQ